MKRDAKPDSMMPATTRKLRCAVYTRKSSEEGLDMEFNSLDAQREACEAYIASQRAEGWVLVRDHYDDGGVSGGTLERPALKRLVADIQEGLVDVVVVYKIDRLSRSLVDFTKLVEVFDANSVTFVSVTQAFNTTTSMGRLTLNILLSFAQFEREVIGERIRDKVAASRRRGMWMGGFVPLGYDVRDRKLVVNEAEAALVRRIFRGFVEMESATRLVQALRVEGATTKRGRPITKSDAYRILCNRVYLGDAVHKGTAYPGEHDAIITQRHWDAVHAILQVNPRVRINRTRNTTAPLLRGLIAGGDVQAARRRPAAILHRRADPSRQRLAARSDRRTDAVVLGDEGAQVTASLNQDGPGGRAYAGLLQAAGVRVSMHGRGRWMDNVFIERLRRSVTYECVYLHALETGSELRAGLANSIGYYNGRRPHSALAGRTPNEAYAGTTTEKLAA